MKRRKSPMKCSVLRSSLKAFTYIYLADEYAFEDLPVSLRKVFGEPVIVMTLELTPERKLACEDVNQVMQNLAENGYHLQMPPQEDATGLLDLP
jgi:uncharacterized protein